MEGCAQTASYKSLLRRKNFAHTELLNIALHDDKLCILITLALPEYSTVASMVCKFHRCQVFRAPITRMSVATSDILAWLRGHVVTRLRSARELSPSPKQPNYHQPISFPPQQISSLLSSLLQLCLILTSPPTRHPISN